MIHKAESLFDIIFDNLDCPGLSSERIPSLKVDIKRNSIFTTKLI